MQRFGGIVVFVALALAARYYSINKFHGGATTPRTPAAIPKTFDYSHLEGPALESAIQRRLLTGTEFTRVADGVELHLGHFVTSNNDGKPAFACEVFNRVTFTFEADGFATAGERTTLEVEGPCEMSANISEMQPLLIPVGNILNEKPGNLELNYMIGTPISLKFSNMPDEWPRQWVLSGIKIYNREDGRSFIVDQKNLRKLATEPLTMVW
ncbi:MAG TPA: hypothetical protein VFV50_08735 [Bdellovibrionales bacterium]|nr:hypothetical protein [Bdellovibrionales bacterium]